MMLYANNRLTFPAELLLQRVDALDINGVSRVALLYSKYLLPVC